MKRTAILVSLLTALFALACGQPERAVNAPVPSMIPSTVSEPIAHAVEPVEPVDVVDVVPVVERTLLEEEGIFTEPDDDAAYGALARVLLDEGKTGEAIEPLRRALYKTPTPAMWTKLGTTYLAAGEAERGVKCLQEAVEKDRYQFDAHQTLAQHFFDAGEYATAKPYAEHVAINRIDDVPANYLAGRIYTKLGMWKEAILTMGRVVEVEPDHKYARNNLGFAALQLGQDELALHHLEATLDLEPTSYMMNNLGIAYERNLQHIDAFASYVRAVELQPGYVKALLNRARVGGDMSADEKILALDIAEEMKAPTQPSAAVASGDSPLPE